MRLLLAGLAVLALTSSPAIADDSYLRRTATADGVSGGVIVLSGYLYLRHHGFKSFKKAPGEITQLFYLGVGGLILGTPIVHAAHGNWRQGLVSAGLRLAVPVSGYAVWKGCTAFFADSDGISSSEHGACDWMTTFAVVGFLTAAVIHDVRVARRGADHARPIIFKWGRAF